MAICMDLLLKVFHMSRFSVYINIVESGVEKLL